MTQKALDIRKRLFLPCLLSALAFAVLTFGSVSQARAATSVRPGFPDSFVELYTSHYGAFVDTGGKGEGQTIGGFGGLKGETRAANRQARERIPVILLHGNGVHALQSEEIRLGFIPIPTLGVWPIGDFLVDRLGYNDAEIWAVSYSWVKYTA